MQELLFNLEKPFNVWQIITGLIAYNVIGMIWHGLLFNKPWMTAVGFTKEMMEQGDFKEKSLKYFLISEVFNLISVFGYAILINALVTTVSDLFILVILLWVTISVHQHSAAVLWERRPPRLFFINAGHSLFSLVLIGYLIYYLK